MKTQYPLEAMLPSPLPQGVDPQHLEVYVSDQDFQVINSEQEIQFSKIVLGLLFHLTLFSINERLQLYFRQFWKWREMNAPPSRDRSKLIWRKANGCCAKQRIQPPPQRIDTPRTAQNITERAKKSTFNLCQPSVSVWNVYRTPGFSVATVSNRK